uniref:Uncharacterized protein n=1 Tax=Nothobranchius furzeri TaxID=105023 RepID=A0A8C6P5V2_NOTFU
MHLVIEEQSKQARAVDPAVPHRVRHSFTLPAASTAHFLLHYCHQLELRRTLLFM